MIGASKRGMAMASDLVGKTLGDFQLEELVGKGSMAKVYAARQISLRRPVALKILEEGIFTPHDNIKRFLREAEAMARLEHPHIVPVYAAGEELPYYYFAMRLIREGSLSDAMRKGMQRAKGVRWAYEICQALAFAHGAGVVHRDLKPSNVLIQDGIAMLADFGLARLRDMSTITQKGFLLGTPLYMSPEQTYGDEAGPTSDCFALGVIFYEMLLGHHPFTEKLQKGLSKIEVRVQLFERIQRAEYIAPPENDPDFPPAIVQVIKKSLTRRPEERYPNGAAMLKDLEEAYKVISMPDRVIRVHPFESDPPKPASKRMVKSEAVTDSKSLESTADMVRVPITKPPPVSERRFGRYKIVREIGHGGQGIVYQAHDPILDRNVALKVLQSDSQEDEQLNKLFLHEARVAARLSHPHIIPIYDFGVEMHSPYLTMQLVEGPSLDRLLEKGNALPLAYALTVLVQSADALGCAHDAGVIHLDVKPGNILLRRSNRGMRRSTTGVLDDLGLSHVLLTDFTMARMRTVTSPSQAPRSGSKKSNDSSGAHSSGTIPYAAPEQLRGERAELGPATDVFSLGIVLHEMLTGKRLFGSDNTSITQMLVLRSEIPRPSTRAADIPPDVDDLCMRMLQLDAKKRFQTAAELLAAATPILARVEG